MYPRISNIIIFGDSLTDRGTFDGRYLFGRLIPLKKISGLDKQSPSGRFTNGLTWADHLSTALANKFITEELLAHSHHQSILNHIANKYCYNATDLADGILCKDRHIRPIIQKSYTLTNDLFVKYKGRQFVRSYHEGGLTAHDYSHHISKSLSRFLTRRIVSTLEEKRNLCLTDDMKEKTSDQQKKQTLILEWTGANDLMTVNEKPTRHEVDCAIHARIDNVKILIQHGYRHFILFNMPDLSLLPRYQNKNGKQGDYERYNAKMCSIYFNEELTLACQELQKNFTDCTIHLFDVATKFAEMYDHPEKYHLDKTKNKKPYVNSPDFLAPSHHTSPATGYLFWDDVHPSADVQAIISKELNDFLHQHYTIKALPETEEELYDSFIDEHGAQLSRHNLDLLNAHSQTKAYTEKKCMDHTIELVKILKLALYDGEEHTRNTLIKLGWINQNNEVNSKIPGLEKANRLLMENLKLRSEKKC